MQASKCVWIFNRDEIVAKCGSAGDHHTRLGLTTCTLSDMSEVLPVELISAIAVAAAEQEVYTDRSWIVQLALVGREVFHVVRPTLYADLVITYENEEKIASIHSLGDRILPYVRRITATSGSASLDSILRKWRPQAGCYIQVPWMNLKRLLLRLSSRDSDEDNKRLTGLDLEYSIFIKTCLYHSAEIPATIASHITHLSTNTAWDETGVSGSISDTAASPRFWANAILATFPCLTHLGMAIPDYWERPDYEDDVWTNKNWWSNPSQLREVIQVLLELRDILFVSLRVVSDCASREAHMRTTIANSLHSNSRFTFWVDERSVWTCLTFEAFAIEDAWHGRNIWSGPPSDGLGLVGLFECLD